jgi:hypothetical protein
MASLLSKKLQKSATTAKKTDRPVLGTYKELVDQTVTMKKELEDLNAQYAATEGQLIEKAKEIYSNQRSAGTYASSILCEGKDTDGCMVVFSDKFSNLPLETETELRKLDPNYDKHFVEARKLEVKRTGKTISDETVNKIMKALGDDLFFELFEVKQEIGTIKGLAEMYDELPKEVQDMLKQSKASVRNVTVDGKVI